MPLVAGDEIVGTRLHGRRQYRLIFGRQMDARRQRRLRRIGDEMGLFKKSFEPPPVLVADTVSSGLVGGVEEVRQATEGVRQKSRN
jgi:hypothetical protein